MTINRITLCLCVNNKPAGTTLSQLYENFPCNVIDNYIGNYLLFPREHKTCTNVKTSITRFIKRKVNNEEVVAARCNCLKATGKLR